MVHETSAGAVIFTVRDGQPHFLLLQYSFENYQAWDFPRGSIESGESEAAAAMREIREETGIQVDAFVPGFREINRWTFQRKGQPHTKQIIFFLAETPTTDVRLSREHREAAWLTRQEASKRMSFESGRRILEAAHRFILQKGLINGR